MGADIIHYSAQNNVQVTTDVTFLTALTIADSVCTASAQDETCIRHLARLLHQLAHAVWEPSRIDVTDREYLLATLERVRLKFRLCADWPRGARQAEILASTGVDEANAQVNALYAGIVDFIVRAASPRFEVRRCLECATWFTPRVRSARSKFCSDRCRNAFHYRKRCTAPLWKCSHCEVPRSIDHVSGLELRAAQCVMSGLRTGRDLLCAPCVAAYFPVWLRYAEGTN